MNYPKLPDVSIPDEQKIDNEKIFEKTEEKTPSLRTHLADARKKSLEVRRAKAEIKKANKKPPGRPKKVKVIEPTPSLETENVKLDIEEKPIEEIIETKTEVQSSGIIMKTPVIKEALEIKTAEPLDYDKLADLVVGKLGKREKPTQQIPQQVHQPYYDPSYMSHFENKIRTEERQKIAHEKQKEKEDLLKTSTRNYFKRMPPINYFEPTDLYDFCFNPKRR